MEYYTKESQLHTAILQFLKWNKIMAWKCNNAVSYIQGRRIINFQDENGQSIQGVPDIMGYFPDGKSLFIEVKRGKGKPTEYQRNFIENALSQNCISFFAWSVDDVKNRLKEKGYLK